VRAIAGHVSEKAIRYHSHIRIEAKKAAVDRLQAPALTAKKKSARSTKSAPFPMLTEGRGCRQAARNFRRRGNGTGVGDYERSRNLNSYLRSVLFRTWAKGDRTATWDVLQVLARSWKR
jgi:hypothetical protein